MDEIPKDIEKQEKPKSLYEQLEEYNALPDDKKEEMQGELRETINQMKFIVSELEDPVGVLNSQVTSTIPEENDLDRDPDLRFELSLSHVKDAMEKIIKAYSELF